MALTPHNRSAHDQGRWAAARGIARETAASTRWRTCSPTCRSATKTAYILRTIKNIQPNGVYTIRATVLSGRRFARCGRYDAVYHMLVKDATGSLPVNFFTAVTSKGASSPGKCWYCTGKQKSTSSGLRASRWSIRRWRWLGSGGEEAADSTEVGRIVPIYEAIGTFGSRAIRRAIYAALQLLDPRMPEVLPEELRVRLGFPPRAQAVAFAHFPPPEESVEALNE